MLISVLNIKLTCEWHKDIKLNYKNTRTRVIVVLRVTSTIHEKALRWRNMADFAKRHAGTVNTAFHCQGVRIVTWRISCAGCSIWNRKKPPLFSGHYLRNRSTLDIGVLGYIYKEHSPEVWHIAPGTPCICSVTTQTAVFILITVQTLYLICNGTSIYNSFPHTICGLLFHNLFNKLLEMHCTLHQGSTNLDT